MPRTTVLLTGFEPFDGAQANPSWVAVQRAAELWHETVPGHELVTAELPVLFGTAADRLDELLAAHAPGLVVATGVASKRTEVTPERVAINVADARIPDNAGEQPEDRPIVPGGPAAYFSTLPLRAAVAAAQASGVPCAVSNTAGTYVCNDVFYRLMHATATTPAVRAGFVHVPPDLPADDVARGLLAIVRASLAVTAEAAS